MILVSGPDNELINFNITAIIIICIIITIDFISIIIINIIIATNINVIFIIIIKIIYQSLLNEGFHICKKVTLNNLSKNEPKLHDSLSPRSRVQFYLPLRATDIWTNGTI
ncbi:hypothetical protein Bpfe_030849 [Biomphalaria pfeifferi]|uniref:Uncharacterized protein n=1 Tax=Biomphalaria pfeifferi TaxID=112525 RepID=A0AAD8ETG3_BIOPF|nr:hypothetical protein Bpfe_030849 [Biomphalaria pfeifferi]